MSNREFILWLAFGWLVVLVVLVVEMPPATVLYAVFATVVFVGLDALGCSPNTVFVFWVICPALLFAFSFPFVLWTARYAIRSPVATLK